MTKLFDTAIFAKDDMDEQDSLGGNFLPTGLYGMKFTAFYVEQASSGATMIYMTLTDDATKRKVNISECIANKKGENTYTDKDGNKKPMIGLTKVNTMVILATGSPITELDFEKKSVGIYDRKLKKELIQQREVGVEMIGKPVKVGLLAVTEYGSKQVDGAWTEDKSKQFTNNEVGKMFDTEGRTAAEIKAEKAPDFIEKWAEKYSDKTIDRTNGEKPDGTESASESETKAKKTKTLF